VHGFGVVTVATRSMSCDDATASLHVAQRYTPGRLGMMAVQMVHGLPVVLKNQNVGYLSLIFFCGEPPQWCIVAARSFYVHPVSVLPVNMNLRHIIAL